MVSLGDCCFHFGGVRPVVGEEAGGLKEDLGKVDTGEGLFEEAEAGTDLLGVGVVEEEGGGEEGEEEGGGEGGEFVGEEGEEAFSGGSVGERWLLPLFLLLLLLRWCLVC